jgi:S1-C subfamily serine protease
MAAVVSALSRVKNGLTSHLQSSKQNLNASKTELERLRAEYNIGELSGKAFRSSEQRLQKSIDSARAEIARLQSLVDAKSSKQISTDVTEPIEVRRQHKILPAWAIVTLVVICVPIAAFLTAMGISTIRTPSVTPATPASVESPQPSQVQPATPQPSPLDWTTIAVRTKPSVVRVLAKESYSKYGVGSGIIIAQGGYILTCNHVVENALSIKIASYDGKQYDASVISTNSNADLAMLKISSNYANTQGLIVATLGDSDVSQDGEEIMAIGYPPLLEKDVDAWLISDPKVTKGIVSGKSVYEGVNLIQTDAPVSGGNSGGPLINRSGEVIGVVSFVVIEEKAQNANFAVAINYAKQFIKQATGQ